MIVRVVAFAGLREALGFGEREIEVSDRATAEEVWNGVASEEAGKLRASTRFALNGSLIEAGSPLAPGDELAFLPPVSGG